MFGYEAAKSSFSFLKCVLLDISNGLFGRIPNMFNRVFIGCIGWHSNEVDSFK